MSALDDLIARFQRDLYKPDEDHLRNAGLEAIHFYNRVARELAEQVRAAAEPPEGHEWTVWNGGMEDAADLIDPEVADG